jgi:hypothetical protein
VNGIERAHGDWFQRHGIVQNARIDWNEPDPIESLLPSPELRDLDARPTEGPQNLRARQCARKAIWPFGEKLQQCFALRFGDDDLDDRRGVQIEELVRL